MAVVAEFTIPPDALPGGGVLEEMPDQRIELERIVPTEDTALPYFWVFGGDSEDLVERFRAEPDIADARVLADVEGATLFEATWRPDAEIISGIRTLRATVLDATGTADGWQFRVRAEGRERLAAFQRIFDEQDVPVDLERLYDFSEIARTERPLTDQQRETLLVAYREGYFDKPRGIDQGELAERFGVSSRAVSDRLRRGIRNLVGNTLTAGAPEGTGEGE